MMTIHESQFRAVVRPSVPGGCSGVMLGMLPATVIAVSKSTRLSFLRDPPLPDAARG